jgi:integrase
MRALKWSDIDLDQNTMHIVRSLDRSGSPKTPKTEAGKRMVAIVPQLRKVLIAWKMRSPRTRTSDYVICAADGNAVTVANNASRALEAARKRAGISTPEGQRLSWHSLRHSAGSMWVNEWSIPVATAAKMIGHKDASFMLRCYVREARDEATVVADVLARAASI